MTVRCGEAWRKCFLELVDHWVPAHGLNRHIEEIARDVDQEGGV